MDTIETRIGPSSNPLLPSILPNPQVGLLHPCRIEPRLAAPRRSGNRIAVQEFPFGCATDDGWVVVGSGLHPMRFRIETRCGARVCRVLLTTWFGTMWTYTYTILNAIDPGLLEQTIAYSGIGLLPVVAFSHQLGLRIFPDPPPKNGPPAAQPAWTPHHFSRT